MVVIAVDGPSGSGKSSVSKQVARRLGLAYLDTGAMYRAATLWAKDSVGDLDDQPAVAAAVRAMPLEVGLDPDNPRFVLDGADVTAAIRDSAVSTQVSKIATNLAVRDELRRRQREIITDAASKGGGIIAEGRDITTVVAPDAPVRILLTASPEQRLKRRSLEVYGSDDAQAVAATTDQVLRRDADDSTVMEFQKATDGVITVDSSNLNLDQTVDAVLDAAKGADGHGQLPVGRDADVGDSLAAMPLRGPWTPANEGGLPTGVDIPEPGDGLPPADRTNAPKLTSADPASAADQAATRLEQATEAAGRSGSKTVAIDTDHGRAFVAEQNGAQNANGAQNTSVNEN